MSSPQLKSQNREEDDILTRDCRELYGANYIVETYNELTTQAKAFKLDVTRAEDKAKRLEALAERYRKERNNMVDQVCFVWHLFPEICPFSIHLV